MKNTPDTASITLSLNPRTLRALVRKAVRWGIAITREEELVIEDEFLRLARLRMKP